MPQSKYGSINDEDIDIENINNNRYSSIRQILLGTVIVKTKWLHNDSVLFLGFFLALVSGGLFTANNFILNQYQVNAGDLLLVRTVLQLVIYICICFYR